MEQNRLQAGTDQNRTEQNGREQATSGHIRIEQNRTEHSERTGYKRAQIRREQKSRKRCRDMVNTEHIRAGFNRSRL